MNDQFGKDFLKEMLKDMAIRLALLIGLVLFGLMLRFNPEYKVLSVLAWGLFMYPIVELYMDWKQPGKWEPFKLTMGAALLYNLWLDRKSVV